MEKNINIKIMGVFASILLLVIIVTASFAYFGSFNVNLNNNVAVNVNIQSPCDGTFTLNATQLNLQVPAVNMSQTQSNNTVATLENTAALTISLTSGVAKEITMTVNTPSGTSNFSNETNLTWSEWFESNYDSKGIIIKDSNVYYDDICLVYIYINGVFHNVKPNETIIDKI